jgi:hypothetical protein
MHRDLKSLPTAIGVVLAFVLVSPAPAWGYIDPGSGSFFLQMLLAGLLGLGMTLRLYGRRIKAFFRRNKSSSDDDSDAQ